MPERRYAPINGGLTDTQKSEDATVSGNWTFDAGAGDSTLTVESSTGDAAILIKADTDNATETDNPTLRMEQDGNAVQLIFGLTGADSVDSQGATFTNSSSNGIALRQAFGNGTIGMGVGDTCSWKMTSNGEITHYSRGIYDLGNGEALTLIGGSTGNAMNTWIQFDESDDSRAGFIGYGSSGNQDMYIWNDLSGVFRFGALSVDADVRAYDSNTTDYISIRGNSDAGIISSTQHIRLSPGTSHAIQFYKNSQTVYTDWYDSTGTDSMRMYHNGTDFYQTATNTTWLRTSGLTGHLNLLGIETRWYDSDNSDSIRIQHDNTWGVIDKGNSANLNGIRITPGTSSARGNLLCIISSNVADDGTWSQAIPCTGGFYRIVAMSTSANESTGYLDAFWNSTSTNTSFHAGSGIWSLGTGSNPNIDGDHNVWFTTSGTVINIKNRRGASRYYAIYVMSGD